MVSCILGTLAMYMIRALLCAFIEGTLIVEAELISGFAVSIVTKPWRVMHKALGKKAFHWS